MQNYNIKNYPLKRSIFSGFFVFKLKVAVTIFTGLIEETGTIEKIEKSADSAHLKIKADKIFSDLKIGDSVAVNGICLTVTRFSKPYFNVDVMHETINRTSLSDLVHGSKVNLERAMPAMGRFGGHIVSGHIDGTGKIISFNGDGIAVWIKIQASKDILKYIVEKGSVCLDGVSLTVADITQSDFAVSIIPHTAQNTTLLSKKCGDKINIECDIIAKYVEKLSSNKNNTLSEDFFKQNGFI